MLYLIVYLRNVLVMWICTGKLVWSSLVMLLLSKYSNHGKYLTTFHAWSMNWLAFHHTHGCWTCCIEQPIELGLEIHFSALTILLVVTAQNQWVNISYFSRYSSSIFIESEVLTVVGTESYIIWYLMQWSLLKVSQHYGGTCSRLRNKPSKKVSWSRCFQQTTCCYIPE